MVQTFIDGLSAILYLAFVLQHLFKQFTVISSAILSVNHLWVSQTIHRFANLFLDTFLFLLKPFVLQSH